MHLTFTSILSKLTASSVGFSSTRSKSFQLSFFPHWCPDIFIMYFYICTNRSWELSFTAQAIFLIHLFCVWCVCVCVVVVVCFASFCWWCFLFVCFPRDWNNSFLKELNTNEIECNKSVSMHDCILISKHEKKKWTGNK